MNDTFCDVRRIVLLFDGTCNGLANRSVITRLSEMLVNSRLQLVHIESGSGTHGKWWHRLKSAKSGIDAFEILEMHYKWLANVVQALGCMTGNFELYLFGFSRGAYQARLFVEMIELLGLPCDSNCCHSKVEQFKRYLASGRKGGLNLGMNSCLHNRIRSVEYLGLFDTVSTCPKNWNCCPTASSFVGRCRHAVALNEGRSKFKPELIRSGESANVEERWFLGDHSDVGGGHQESKTLGLISAWWVLEPVFNKLDFVCDPSKFSRSSINLKSLLSRYWYVMHDLYHSVSNCFGLFGFYDRSELIGELDAVAKFVQEADTSFNLFSGIAGYSMKNSLRKNMKDSRKALNEIDHDRISSCIAENQPKIDMLITKYGLG